MKTGNIYAVVLDTVALAFGGLIAVVKFGGYSSWTKMGRQNTRKEVVMKKEDTYFKVLSTELNRVIYWVEPDEKEEAVLRSCTVAEAIDYSKKTAEVVRKGEFIYQNDQDALDDFITVNWAWVEEMLG